MRAVNRFFRAISSYRFRRQIGTDVSVHWRSFVGDEVYIGDHTNINGSCYLSGNVSIGKWCAIAHGFRARSKNLEVCFPNMQAKLNVRHGFKQVHGLEKGPISIGNGCWIGDRVTVLSGVSIGDGAVVGAGSVVTKDVPDFAIFAGNPARLIKMRFERSVVDMLVDLKWWDWSEDKIRKNKCFFESDLSQLCDVEQVSRLVVD